VKTSNWTRLIFVSHFHQAHGRNPKAFPLPPFHERVEVVTGGRGAIRDGGRWRDVEPGDLIWNGPGDETIGRSDFADPYRCLAVMLACRRRNGTGMPRFSRWADIDEILAFTHECVRLQRDEAFDREALREYVLSRLVFRVRLHQHEAGRNELPAPLLAALRKLEEDHGGPCRLTDLAEVSGWSAAHLHEMFRRHLQTTPHQMLMRLRLRKARERLVSTSQPVKQVAVECGFSDPAAFANAFRARVGVTPGEYRQQFRGR